MARRTFAYECRYCGKLFRSWKLALRHENSCLKNPDRINCIDCEYYNKDYLVKNAKGEIKPVPTCMRKMKKCSKALSGICTEFKHKESDNNE